MAKLDNLLKKLRYLQGGPKPMQRFRGYTPPDGRGYISRVANNHIYDGVDELEDVSLYLGGGPARTEPKGYPIKRSPTGNYDINRPLNSEVEHMYPTTDEIIQWIKDNQ